MNCEKWLSGIALIEECNGSLIERLKRTLVQIRQDGLVTVCEMERLNFIGKHWIILLTTDDIHVYNNTVQILKEYI